jgi:four helix bundle protein
MGDFKRLIVWQRARQVALSVYRATGFFPAEERFGLVSQLRRAAVSVTANIAESCGRHSRGDEVRLLQVAQGSAHELESTVLLAHDLGFITGAAHEPICSGTLEVQRMLATLIRRKQLQRRGG